MNTQKNDKNTIIVNLFGGPGVGKSTLAATIFSKLKEQGIDCELALEYAKEKVWDESYKIMDDTLYIFAKQHHRIWRLNNRVNIIITDAPLLNPIIYDLEKNLNLKKLIISEFNKFNNLNFLLKRSTKYDENGRLQKIDEAQIIDNEVKKLLDDNNFNYLVIEKEDINLILEKINNELCKI